MTEYSYKGNLEIPSQLGILPLRNMVLFPGVPTRLLVGRAGSLQLIEQAMEQKRLIAIAKAAQDAFAGDV